MPRTALTVTDLDPFDFVADPTPAAGDDTDGNIVAGVPLEQLILRVTNTDTEAAHDLVVLAGFKPPALENGMGDLEVTLEEEATVFVGPFESGRFMQADGSLHVDVDASDLEITAFRLPRRF